MVPQITLPPSNEDSTDNTRNKQTNHIATLHSRPGDDNDEEQEPHDTDDPPPDKNTAMVTSTTTKAAATSSPSATILERRTTSPRVDQWNRVAPSSAPPPQPTVSQVSVVEPQHDVLDGIENHMEARRPLSTERTTKPPQAPQSDLEDRVHELEMKLAVLSRLLQLQRQQQQQQQQQQQHRINSSNSRPARRNDIHNLPRTRNGLNQQYDSSGDHTTTTTTATQQLAHYELEDTTHHYDDDDDVPTLLREVPCPTTRTPVETTPSTLPTIPFLDDHEKAEEDDNNDVVGALLKPVLPSRTPSCESYMFSEEGSLRERDDEDDDEEQDPSPLVAPNTPNSNDDTGLSLVTAVPPLESPAPLNHNDGVRAALAAVQQEEAEREAAQKNNFTRDTEIRPRYQSQQQRQVQQQPTLSPASRFGALFASTNNTQSTRVGTTSAPLTAAAKTADGAAGSRAQKRVSKMGRRNLSFKLLYDSNEAAYEASSKVDTMASTQSMTLSERKGLLAAFQQLQEAQANNGPDENTRGKWLDFLNSFQESTHDVDLQMEEFVKVPEKVERLMAFGFFICVDSFLYIFTILPIRFVWSFCLLILRMFWWARKPSPQFQFHRRHSYQLIQVCVVYCIYQFVLCPISIGQLYHWIRGQAMIKLYVLIAIVEVFDRLMCALGQDSLGSMYWNTVNRPKSFRMLISVLVVLVYATIHTLLLFVHVATLNVAMNSADQALLTLLISGNFAEIKSTVFKKYNKAALFKLSAMDICERFKLALFLTLVLLLNVSQGMDRRQYWDYARVCGIVWCGELVADWIKHSFITKFNIMPAKVYIEYVLLLAGDVTGIGHEGVNLDHSHAVVKRIGFAQLPLVCVALRLLREAVKYATRNAYWPHSFFGAPLLMSAACWVALLMVKIALGNLLKFISMRKLRDAPEISQVSSSRSGNKKKSE